MTNKNKRQERFVQKIRFKKRVKNLMNYNACYASPRIYGMLYKTRTLCSCTMCGNARTHFGDLTKQEISDIELLKLELSVINDN